ncbi:pyridoxamine 5'-phosphate oxidase family protein [Deinococcus sp.]|uniref:pyridoxamine 5'-phosphate oxidase family protein n=1 Tax=Deinococcus sp. TaxID=47478 RepID=UPI0025C6A61D|nr:pyridoxamine 5'-phosphate oxidase family protein [Deinococcus sp.]
MTDFYDPRQRDPSLSRRPKNRQGDDWIRALLLRVPVGRVATVWQGEDGEAFPFITPLAFAYRAKQHDIVYHTNIVGRLRANTGQGHAPDGVRATFEASEIGALLPSNSPLELSVQYRSVIVFGTAHLITDPAEQEAALTTLSERVFPDLKIGQHTRPISAEDLKRTSVYTLNIAHWSGKENWAAQAIQEEEWPALAPELARLRPTS